MSIEVNISSIPQEDRIGMSKDLVVKEKETMYKKNTTTIYPYKITEIGVGYFPYAYMRSKGYKNNRKFEKHSGYTFTGTLREEQIEVRNKCVNYLNTTGSCLLSMYPGFGKTAIGIELSTRIRLRTIVVVNRIVLLNQWKDSINKFCPDAKVSTCYTEINDCDFLIVNAINVEKIVDTVCFGLMIVDECHMIVTETLSKCLLSVTPKYLLGLSATPYRSDGMDLLIDMYFGLNKIVKSLYRKHIVYVVRTGFTPIMKIGRNGKPDWNSVIQSQSESVERMEMINKLVNKFINHKFLVLCKRVEQAKLVKECISEPVSVLYGSLNTYDQSSRILVATVQKAGVGFDDNTINALVLASDLQEYFIQYLGRCMRRPDVEPIVFDLVDNNCILEKHFKERIKVYEESGGEIKYLKL